jgi:predicted ATP-grasp superfamily ATP-dependent carboligase
MKVLLLATESPDDRKTLCVIRSLAKAGIQLTVASDSFKGRSFHSRYARSRIRIPHPSGNLERFTAALQDILGRDQFDVVLPTNDYTTLALTQIQHEIPNSVGIPVPGRKAIAISKDKQTTMEFAKRLGLPVPDTHCPRDPGELEKIAEIIAYPCVIKPRKGAGGIGMRKVSSKEELLTAYATYPPLSDDVFDFSRPLIQEFIQGHVHEVCTLFMHGQPRAMLTQQRLLQYPDGGGGGIYNETTDEDDLKEMAISLLQALEWHGPAQVEFMRERRTGRPYLLEVNGRFWGSMDLAVAAGMDFPVLTCKMAARGDVETQLDYRVGLRFRWPFPYAILHAMETGRWAGAFKDFLAPRKATRSDLVVTDPMPLIMEFYYTLERLWKRRFKTLRSTKDWTEFIVQDKSE